LFVTGTGNKQRLVKKPDVTSCKLGHNSRTTIASTAPSTNVIFRLLPLVVPNSIRSTLAVLRIQLKEDHAADRLVSNTENAGVLSLNFMDRQNSICVQVFQAALGSTMRNYLLGLIQRNIAPLARHLACKLISRIKSVADGIRVLVLNCNGALAVTCGQFWYRTNVAGYTSFIEVANTTADEWLFLNNRVGDMLRQIFQKLPNLIVIIFTM
jgi:hypothetical protein